MKRVWAVLCAAGLAAALLCGCVGTRAELALISSSGTVEDGSFNQGAWAGLVRYAEEKDRTYAYYAPASPDEQGYLEAVALAVKGGAKVIVLPGSTFSQTAQQAQETYQEVSFILLDSLPTLADGTEAEPASNLVAVTFADEQAGFLAGYAAVKEGFTSLGFLGGKNLAPVARYGYGFLQGADYAASLLGLAPGSVTIRYAYAGSFDETQSTQDLAVGWYADGIQCIFACAGGGGKSVMKAAEAAGAKMIGVDVDQSAQSTAVITSATKGVGNAVYDALAAYDAGSFPGGQRLQYDVTNNGVGLALDNSRMSQFARSDYDDLYAMLVNNTNNLTESIVRETAEDGSPTSGGLHTTVVQVEEVAAS